MPSVQRRGSPCTKVGFLQGEDRPQNALCVYGDWDAGNVCSAKRAASDNDHLIRPWSPTLPLMSPVPVEPARALLLRPPSNAHILLRPPVKSVCTCGFLLLVVTRLFGQHPRAVLHLSLLRSFHYFIPWFLCAHQGQGSGFSSLRLQSKHIWKGQASLLYQLKHLPYSTSLSPSTSYIDSAQN